MNEQIKKLYLCSFAPSISDSAVCEEGAKKFAELIVRECAEQIVEYQPRYLTHGQAQEMAESIKQHFGVEK